MDHITFIGSAAAVCTTMAFLPQVIRVYRTKHTHDLSLPMYVIFCAGVLLWGIYGFLTKSLPIMIANALTFIMSLYILGMKIRYK